MRHAVAICVVGLLTAFCVGACSEPSAPDGGTRPASAPVPVGWRGDGTGVYPEADPPTEWDGDAKTNIVWTAEVGPGFSTPLIVGDRIVLTSESDVLLCVRKSDGEILWSKANGPKSLPSELKSKLKPQPSGCGQATPTPVSDGRFVWASFGTGVVVCYDLEGNRRWVRLIDRPVATAHGRSASPVLAGDRLLVSLECLIALGASTGKMLWEARAAPAGYGTPAVVHVGGEAVAVTPTGAFVKVADGEVLAAGVAETEFASPAPTGDAVIFTGAPTVAVRLPETLNGKFAPTLLWEADGLEGEFYASAVVADGKVYCVNNDGRLYAVNRDSGEVAWEHQLEIPSGSGIGGQTAYLYPSPALAGGKIFLGNDAGTMLVLKPGDEYEQVSENALDEGSGACPVFEGERLYLRGGKNLYCIGRK